VTWYPMSAGSRHRRLGEASGTPGPRLACGRPRAFDVSRQNRHYPARCHRHHRVGLNHCEDRLPAHESSRQARGRPRGRVGSPWPDRATWGRGCSTDPERHQSQRRHYPTGPDAIFAEYRCRTCYLGSAPSIGATPRFGRCPPGGLAKGHVGSHTDQSRRSRPLEEPEIGTFRLIFPRDRSGQDKGPPSWWHRGSS
jgi:hypothetical protein